MSQIRVRALYDFDGQPGTSEISITAGETLTLTSKDVGEGWWEGRNIHGQSGIFPAAYVEEIAEFEAPPPAMPPPPLPDTYTNDNGSQQYDDDWDDDWDDDVSEATPARPNYGSTATGIAPFESGSNADVSHMGKIGDGKGTVRMSLNPFTTFSKTAGEAFILGTTKAVANDMDKIYITETAEGVVWSKNDHPFSCLVASPKKESKLKGLKSFIAYQLTPSFNNIQVSRRYKHFDWLHERLVAKFISIPIPPLPDKQISGRYEEQFIERRRLQLQSFVDRVSRHPVLSHSEVWLHFLTCTDAKRWKAGKRKAEKDELVGSAFFSALVVPERPLDPLQLESQNESLFRYVQSVDSAVRLMQTTAAEEVKRHQVVYKRDFQRVAHAFRNLGSAMENDGLDDATSLTAALRHTGDVYDSIATLCDDQPRRDWEPLGDLMHDYRGLLGSFPDMLSIHKGALQKRREVERSVQEGKTDSGQLARVSQRTDVISYALMAEVSHFHQQRVVDYNRAMKNFLQEQINYYQSIVNKLQEAAAHFKDV